MLYRPEQYQREGTLNLLRHRHFGLLFDPGLGKTATVLHAIKSLTLTKKVKRVLIIAPRLVCIDTWPNEIEKWDQFKSLSYLQLRNEKYINLDRKENIWLINPELPRLVKLFGYIVQRISKEQELPFKSFPHWLTDSYHQKRFRETLYEQPELWPFQMLVSDESSKFKNPGSKRFKVLRKFLPFFDRRIILTGTFAPNGLQDVFSQMYIVDHGKTFGKNITDFRNKYFVPDNPKFHTYKIAGPHAEKEIQKKISPFVMRLDAEEHLDLPELVHNKIFITLPKQVQKNYDEVEKKFFTVLDDDQKLLIPNSQRKYILCRQMASGSFYDPNRKIKKEINVTQFHKFKTERLKILIDELNGKPLLVAYVYRSEMLQIQKDLRKKIPTIGGHTSEKNDIMLLAKWNKRKLPLLLVQSASVSHGLNMQAGGNDICFFSLTDNLEDYEQLIRRIYRRGVKEQVRVHYLICKKTIDVANHRRIQTKEKTERELLKAIEWYRRRKDV